MRGRVVITRYEGVIRPCHAIVYRTINSNKHETITPRYGGSIYENYTILTEFALLDIEAGGAVDEELRVRGYLLRQVIIISISITN